MKLRIIKHKHGTPNPIIMQEEALMLTQVDKVLASTSNPQTIGRNGELPLLKFLARYLPSTFRVASGHFIPPSGKLSPQIDIMILDSRYPLLSENSDGSVIALLHSLVATIEVKTRMTSQDIKEMWRNSIEIMGLASEVKDYGNSSWGSVSTLGFAYRSTNRLSTVENKYIEAADPWKTDLDIYLLSVHEKDRLSGKMHGFMLHFEPTFESEKSKKLTGYFPITQPSYTPLSDLYYQLVQNSYYKLGFRDHSFDDIGKQIMSYMTWSTFR